MSGPASSAKTGSFSSQSGDMELRSSPPAANMQDMIDEIRTAMHALPHTFSTTYGFWQPIKGELHMCGHLLAF